MEKRVSDSQVSFLYHVSDDYNRISGSGSDSLCLIELATVTAIFGKKGMLWRKLHDG